MIRKTFLVAVSVGLAACPRLAADADVSVVRRPDTAQSNPYYPGNRPPLEPSRFIRLPTGAVRPAGWLRRQLELQAAGFVGHMGEVSGMLTKNDNAWLKPDGKGGCFWEEVPYWLRGYTSMAFLLDDPALVAEAKLWLEPSIVGQRASGYFGTEALAGDARHAPDLMPHQNMLYAYRAYYDATGDKRVLDLMTRLLPLGADAGRQDVLQRRLGHGPQQRQHGHGLLALQPHRRRQAAGTRREADADRRAVDEPPRRLPQRGVLPGLPQAGRVLPAEQGPEVPGPDGEQLQRHLRRLRPGARAGCSAATSSPARPHRSAAGHRNVRRRRDDVLRADPPADHRRPEMDGPLREHRLQHLAGHDDRRFSRAAVPDLAQPGNSDARSKAPTLADDGPMEVMNPRDHHCCQHNVACAWPYFAESLYAATPDRGLAAMMYAPCTVTARLARRPGDGKLDSGQLLRAPR